MQANSRKDKLIGVSSIVFCTLIFSTMEVILKMPAVAGAFHPMQITVLRFLVGGVCLIPFALSSLRKKGVRLSKAHVKKLALCGLLCVPLSMVLYQLSIVYGQANSIAVLFSGNPIFVTILAFLLLREAIHWNNVLALGLEVCGILAILNPFGPDGARVNSLSVLLVVISALLFSLYSVYGKRTTAQLGGIVVTCGAFLFGGAELLLLLLLGRVGAVAGLYQAAGLSIFADVPLLGGITAATLPYFLFICVVNSAAGYVFHMMAIEKTGAALTNLIFFFKPVLAPLFALAVLGEAITRNIQAGIVFFLAGSLFGIIPAIWRNRRAASPAPTDPE
jgi:drug/metabolite transporter (DMT)-like permease